MSIGNRIRDLRGREKLEDFADRFKVTASQISRIENGKSGISSDLAIAICEHYNCSLDWLMRGIGTYEIESNSNQTNEPENEYKSKYINLLEKHNKLLEEKNEKLEQRSREKSLQT